MPTEAIEHIVETEAPTEPTTKEPDPPASLEATVGAHVAVSLGTFSLQGTICELSDTHASVLVTNWRLRGRSRVRLHVCREQLQVLPTPPPLDAWGRVEHAQRIKRQANVHFANKDYAAALALYQQAVQTISHVNHTPASPNELRADLVVVLITCCNNAGMCATHLGKWSSMERLVYQGLLIGDALYQKRGKSKILQVLIREGTPESKILGDWRCKSLLLHARALVELSDADLALKILQRAQSICDEFQTSHGKQIRKWTYAAQVKRRELRLKEKERAQAMFAPIESIKQETKESIKEQDKEGDEIPKSPKSTDSPPGSPRSVTESPPSILRSPTNPAPTITKRVSFSHDTKDTEDEWNAEVLTGLCIAGGILLASGYGLVQLFARSKK